MNPPTERQRNHAARVLVTHDSRCTCDVCTWAVRVMKTRDENAPTCSFCGQQFRWVDKDDPPPDSCPDCWRACDCLELNSCPRCAHPRAVIFIPRNETLRCSQCGWSGPASLTQSRGFVPPRFRVVQENLLIPF
jgi:hypothetical protein